MKRMLKLTYLILSAVLLAACRTATPEPASTATMAWRMARQVATGTPSLTPVSLTPTLSPKASLFASTSTPALPTLPATPQHDPAKETQEAEAFCYQDPRNALDDYLSYLYHGEYEKAARLYGGTGDYPNYRDIPPHTGVEESIKIEAESLANFCDGYRTCLRHKIVKEEPVSDFETVFTIYFYEDDGEVFTFVAPIIDDEGYAHFGIMGPEFHLRAQKIDGCFKSLDVPPITP